MVFIMLLSTMLVGCGTSDNVVITVLPEGNFIEDKEMASIAGYLRGTPELTEKKVVILADLDAPATQIIEVIKEINELGIKDVSISTLHE